MRKFIVWTIYATINGNNVIVQRYGYSQKDQADARAKVLPRGYVLRETVIR